MMIAGHRKKLGRVLIDDRVPRNVRERAYYAADGDCIICMPGGRRLSSSYMVTEETQRILEIRLEPDPS
jgi:tRNA(Ile)-lysidine synthase